MNSVEEASPLEKMRVTLDLFEAAMKLQRQNLRRRYPHVPDAQIENLLQAWLYERPGAELGDGEGRVANRFNLGE